MKDIYQEKKQIQQDYYNSTAEKYDAWHTETESAKIVDQWNFVNLQNFLNQEKVDKCLDIASGTGRLSAKLLQVADNVYGVDLSEEVLKIAKNKYPQINFSLGESVALPYEDNFFDLVVINGSLHHFFAKQKTVQTELIEPEAESFVAAELKTILAKVGFEIKTFYTYDYLPRNESKMFLKHYTSYLAWEHRFLARVFPNLGSAIQFLAIKK